jgi:hypothetical protein
MSNLRRVPGWRRGHRLSAVVLLCSVLGAALYAAYAVGALSDAPTPVDFAQNGLSRQSTTKGTPDEMLGEILSRYGGTEIVGARLTGPPADFEPTDGSVPTPPDFLAGQWLHTAVTAGSDGPEAVRSFWEADLVAGALRDAMHNYGNTPLYASEIDLQLPDGTVMTGASGGIGDVAYDQEFTGDVTADGLNHDILSVLVDAGLTIKSVAIINADQSAPAIVAETSDPAGFVAKADPTLVAAYGVPPRYEGYYLEVDDEAGAPVFIQSTSFRTGVGRRWVRPDLDPRHRVQG